MVASGCAGTAATPDTALPTPCAESSVAITAPATGTPVAPGPLIVTGTTAAAGELLAWSARDAEDALLASGFTSSAPAPEGGLFTVPLDLTTGGVSVAVRPAGSSTAGDRSERCATRIAIDVAPSGTLPRWTGGASGEGVANGGFGSWRGSPVPIAGTWADSNTGQLALWQLRPRGEYGSWSGDLEISIGAIGDGETWATAAAGASDERWSRSLREMARLWQGRPGTIYIRFAHEFNGDWYPWSVTGAEVGHFQAAWSRFRTLQQQIFPSSKLVYSPNNTSMPSFGRDWRDAFPGPGQADVVSVSYFNGWPFVDSSGQFQQIALSLDQFGGPRGIEQQRAFAQSVGLPFAVSEWGNHAGFGDSAAFMRQMYGFFNAHAGNGAGQLLYEITFNVRRDDNTFAIYPETRMPGGAAAYRELWSGGVHGG